ncbi:DMT family transporter [Reyranella sp. CPCC 100927]|uniref:DMT family transporter n=1 Tax=Reyranella sp. CPCC 100927 TaxID=2599616 RepID=UPI0015B4E4E9|nr:DMT family transporter [Reyranella sp. CPCC 100927]
MAERAPRSALLWASGGLLLTALIWGTMTPLLKVLTEVIDVWLLAALRYVLGLPFLALCLLVAARPTQAPGKLNPGRLAILGLAMTAFSILYTIGVRYSHPVTAVVVLNFGPVISAVMARFMLGTRTAPGFPVALGLALVGGLMVLYGTPGTRERGLALEGGEPLLVIGQICWQWYSIRAQQWLGDRGQIGLSTITSAVAAFWMVLVYVAMWGGGVAGGVPDTLTWREVAYLIWICVFGVAVAIVLWNVGVSRVGLPVAALHMNASPVFAVLTAAAIGLPPTALQIAGGLLVLGGIVYMQLLQVRRARAG